MRIFTANIFMTKDDIEEEEQRLTEKTGEKCVIVPHYVQEKDAQVLYVCDRTACLQCHPETCSHTSDVRHAKNFFIIGGDRYMERNKKCGT